MRRLIAIALSLSICSPSWSAFSYYKSVTLDHTQAGSTDSTDWPLTIGLDGNVQAADADLKTVGNSGFVQSASGYDIRPYSDSACSSALTYELVYYQATTGKLEMHVKIPTLSHTSDTIIYLCFGDSGISSDGSSNATWNSNYKIVWHLKDGSSLSGTDSTSNASNGSAANSPTAAAGEIDGGMTVGGTGAGIAAADSMKIASYTLPSTGSMSFWFNPAWSSGDGKDWSLAGEGNNSAPLNIFRIEKFTDNNWYAGWFANPTDYRVIVADSVYSVTSGTWYYFSITWNNVSGVSTLYRNGVSKGTSGSLVVPTISNDTTLHSGKNINVAGVSEVGAGSTLDEFRVVATDLGADWLLSDYNSQKPSSTFIAWGAKTALASTTNNCPSPFCGVLQ